MVDVLAPGPPATPLAIRVRRSPSWRLLGDDLSPVELGASGMLYKREDFYAPLGYGGPNGSKLRQLVHLVDRYCADVIPGSGERSRGIVTAASVLSPQVSMGALVAAHYGLPCVVILGGSKPATAVKHENVAIAVAAGATLEFTPVGYNPALQRAAALRHAELPGWMRLHYGISYPADAHEWEVRRFHSVGAAQVTNLPVTVRHLVIPFGSAYSTISVLFGLATRDPLAPVERVTLFGVGPNRLAFLDRQLRVLGVRGRFNLPGDNSLAPHLIRVELVDLHGTRFASYQDRMPFAHDGIDFHPTYEGKTLTFMDNHRREFEWFWEPDGSVLYWIVGSRPSRAALEV